MSIFNSRQEQLPRLLHLQTTTLIWLPPLPVIRIGKSGGQWTPEIDVSEFPDSDIASRSQAEIRVQGDAYFIEDLGSTNGTYLNRSLLRPFTPYQLQFGDRIDFGKDELFTFLFQKAKPKRPSPSPRSWGNNRRRIGKASVTKGRVPNVRNQPARQGRETFLSSTKSSSLGILSRIRNIPLGMNLSLLKIRVLPKRTWDKLITQLAGIALKGGVLFIALLGIVILVFLLSRVLVLPPPTPGTTISVNLGTADTGEEETLEPEPTPSEDSEPSDTQGEETPESKNSPEEVFIKVLDGDTFRVSWRGGKKRTVQLACIDAPESNQQWGQEATTRLWELLQTDGVIYLTEVGTDGHTLTEVDVDNRLVNRQLVREGLAVVTEEQLSSCTQEQYLQAEAEAKKEQLGLWSQSDSVMP